MNIPDFFYSYPYITTNLGIFWEKCGDILTFIVFSSMVLSIFTVVSAKTVGKFCCEDLKKKKLDEIGQNPHIIEQERG